MPPALEDIAIVPRMPAGYTSVWAQYTIRLKPGVREGLAEKLKARGIPTAIYYPKPLHRQTAYRQFPMADGGLPVIGSACRRGDQPADASLSRRADPGPHRRRGARPLGA